MIEPVEESASRTIDPTKTHLVVDFEHDKPLTCCKVDPTGQFVFAGAEDLNVYCWDIATGSKRTLIGHESWVRSLDFSPDGQRLYTAGWDGQLRYWSVNAGQPESMHTIQAHRGFARWIQTSPCGRMLATCGNDRFIRVWDEATGQQMIELSGHDRHPYAVCFHPTDGMLVSQDLLGTVFVWDARRNRRTDTIHTIMTGYDNKFAADMGGARDMRFCADGSLLACAGITNVVNSFAGQQDPVIAVIDWAAKKVTHHLQAADKKTGIMWGVRFHPAGFIVGAVAQQNGKGNLLFWRLNDAVENSKVEDAKEDGTLQGQGQPGKPIELKSFHAMPLDKSARGLDFTPDTHRVAVAHSDGHLRIYEMAEKVAAEKADESG
jgi:WD40 repeat protein